MSVYMNTAWRTQSDWDLVFNQLYSGSPEEIRNGLDSIACWEARLPVPVGVEATSELLYAKLNTHLAERGTTISSHTLQRMYSIALIRFVNSISDLYQTHLKPRSIKDILLSLGIPVWICDQRHDATHHAIPCLSLVESGVEFCYDWIKSYYWDESRRSLSNTQFSGEDFQESFIRVFLDSINQLIGVNQVPLHSLKNKIVNLAKKFSGTEILALSLLEADSHTLLYQNSSPPVGSLPRLHSSLSQLSIFWSNLLQTLDSIRSKKLNICLVAMILKREGSNLERDKAHVLYHGLWLRLALNNLILTPKRKRLTRRVDIHSRNNKNLSHFCTHLAQLAISYPGVYSHAVIKFLTRHSPRILRGRQAANLLKITKWISLIHRSDYQSLRVLSKELPEIVSHQKRLYSIVRKADKNVTWKQLKPERHTSIPIGACFV